VHVPLARSNVYRGLVGDELLAAARCTGFAAAPVRTPRGVVAVLYGDGGPDGHDIAAEQAAELTGLASQLGLVCGVSESLPV
jgi:hypothetical protein